MARVGTMGVPGAGRFAKLYGQMAEPERNHRDAKPQPEAEPEAVGLVS